MILIFRSRICICFRHCVCILLSSSLFNHDVTTTSFSGKLYPKLYPIKYKWYPVDDMEYTSVYITSDQVMYYFQFYPHGENYEATRIIQKYLGHSIYEILKIAL